MMITFVLAGLAVVVGTVAGLVVGFWRGRRVGSALERRAEALRQWTFRSAPTGSVEPGLVLYGRSPEGLEYTRRFEDMETDVPKDRRACGYDDHWYEVASAKKIPDTMQAEVNNRYNSWTVLVATKAREKGNA